jgi:hypothetical protein
MSVKTLASWSAHAHSTRHGNPSGPAALNVDLSNGLSYIGCGERVHTVVTVRKLVLSCMFQCYLPRSEHRSSLAGPVGSFQWAAFGCVSLCNGLQALPRLTSVEPM